MVKDPAGASSSVVVGIVESGYSPAVIISQAHILPMAESILINFTPQETRVAILEQGIVQELHIERHAMRGLVGNIYLGRVVRILPGMQSAFVDIGLERTAFLHVADIWQARVGEMANRETRPIEAVLSEGQTLLVQVIKDPIGTKGARLSTQASIAGRMLVYLPQEKHIGISQRIDEAEREVLRERLTRLVPADEGGGLFCGRSPRQLMTTPCKMTLIICASYGRISSSK